MKIIFNTLVTVTLLFTGYSYALSPSLCDGDVCIKTSKNICEANKKKCSNTPEDTCKKICPPKK